MLLFSIYAIHGIMDDEPKQESARDRATRKWHNNRVMRESITTDEKPIVTSPTLRYEIMTIFKEKHQKTLMQYIIAIQERRRRLLKEKLRRLQMENQDG